jgi:hypothetical protein
MFCLYCIKVIKRKTNNTTLPEQVQNPKQTILHCGTGTKSKTNNTTLPEQVQHPKQTILYCRNRYKMKNKQYYTAGTGTK